MPYQALATDYDGTLATRGAVDGPTLAALARLRDSGRNLVMVTGREAGELAEIFPHLDLFDRVVAENGALILRPGDGSIRVLGDPPPGSFLDALRQRGVTPLSVGRVIVATREPHREAVAEEIRRSGLPLRVVLNKRAVMVLPADVDKAAGLAVALKELRLTGRDAVGVGDAENDQALLDACGLAVAVADAVPALKARADLVTRGGSGAGVVELIDRMLADDLPRGRNPRRVV